MFLKFLYPLIFIIVAINPGPFGKGCELQNNEFPGLWLVTRGANILRPNNPITLSCLVSCSVNLSGCGLTPQWYVSMKADDYKRHSLIDDDGEDVLQTFIDNATYTRGPIECEGTFNLTLTSIGEHHEVLVLCGLERNFIQDQDNSWAVVRKYVPVVSSSQIKQSPAVIVEEGDDASVTCERPLNETTKVHWTLLGSPQQEPIALNDSAESVLLTDGKKLQLMFENFTKNCTSDEDLMCFRLTIFELTQDLTGLTVGCSVSLDKEEELSAVIVIIPTEIFSDQPRNLTAKEGDGISLSCKRSNGTLAEWRFLFETGESLLYSQNESTLASQGFVFHDSEAVEENLHTFSVNVIVTKAMHNLIVTCAAKNDENNSTKFNKFGDHIIIWDDGVSVSGPSSPASTAVIATVTPLVAVVVLLGIVVVTIIAKHIVPHDERARAIENPEVHGHGMVIHNQGNIEIERINEEIHEWLDAGAV